MELLAGARGDTVVGHIAVKAEREPRERLVVERIQLVRQFVRLARDDIARLPVAETHKPLARNLAEDDALWQSKRAMRLERYPADGLGLRAQFDGRSRSGLNKAEQFRRHVDAVEVPAGPAPRCLAELFQLTLPGVHPAYRAVAKDLTGHVVQPRCEFPVLELGIRLVERGFDFHVTRGHLKPALCREQPVFVHLAVVDETLTADPSREQGCQSRIGIGPESNAGLEYGRHVDTVHPYIFVSSQIDQHRPEKRTSGSPPILPPRERGGLPASLFKQ